MNDTTNEHDDSEQSGRARRTKAWRSVSILFVVVMIAAAAWVVLGSDSSQESGRPNRDDAIVHSESIDDGRPESQTTDSDGGESTDARKNDTDKSASGVVVPVSCMEAARIAAEEPEEPEDNFDELKVMFTICSSEAEFVEALSAYPDALPGLEPEQFASNVCATADELAGSPVCIDAA